MRNLILLLTLLLSFEGFTQPIIKRTAKVIGADGKVVSEKPLSDSDFNKILEKHNKNLQYKVDRPLDLKLLQSEFEKLYVHYMDSVYGFKREYLPLLDTISNIQLNYLLNLDRNVLTHGNSDERFKTFEKRFRYLFGSNSYNKYGGEILHMNGNIYVEKVMAKKILSSWLNSAEHKKIMTDKRNKYFSFKFGYNKFGKIVAIGTFSEITK